MIFRKKRQISFEISRTFLSGYMQYWSNPPCAIDCLFVLFSFPLVRIPRERRIIVRILLYKRLGITDLINLTHPPQLNPLKTCTQSDHELILALQCMHLARQLIGLISMNTMSFTAVFSNKPPRKLKIYFHILRYLCGHFPTIHQRINPSTRFCWACCIQLSPLDYTHCLVNSA